MVAGFIGMWKQEYPEKMSFQSRMNELTKLPSLQAGIKFVNFGVRH